MIWYMELLWNRRVLLIEKSSHPHQASHVDHLGSPSAAWRDLAPWSGREIVWNPYVQFGTHGWYGHIWLKNLTHINWFDLTRIQCEGSFTLHFPDSPNQPGDPLAIVIVRTFTRSFCTPSCWFKMRRYLCTWMLWGISPWKRPSVTRMTIGPLETVSETGAVGPGCFWHLLTCRCWTMQESQSKDRDGNDEFGESERKEKKMKMEGQRAQNMELFKREFAWFQIPQIDTCRGTETVCMKGINHILHVGHAVYAYPSVN